MKSLKRVLSLVLAITLMVGLFSGEVFAHAMTLKEIEPGHLQAEYDGGGISERTVITLYDADGNELESGNVDADGNFKFDPSIEWAKAEAADGMGHAVEIERGVETKEIPKVPVVVAVLVVVGFILFRSKKKKEGQ